MCVCGGGEREREREREMRCCISQFVITTIIITVVVVVFSVGVVHYLLAALCPLEASLMPCSSFLSRSFLDRFRVDDLGLSPRPLLEPTRSAQVNTKMPLAMT